MILRQLTSQPPQAASGVKWRIRLFGSIKSYCLQENLVQAPIRLPGAISSGSLADIDAGHLSKAVP
jgi:hypothetical protein